MSKQSFSVDVVPFGLARFGFVELEDGDFLALCSGWQGSVSKDRGRTWSKPQPLMTTSGTPMAGGKGNASILRLASGRLGIQRMVLDDPDPKQGSSNDYAQSFCTSEDEGRTWSEASPINRPGAQGWPYYDVLIQMKSGRLILPVRACYAGDRSEKEAGQAKGTVKGHRVGVEGHAHYPELEVAFVYYSDDDGTTWRRAVNHVIGWPHDGRRGAYAVDEPTVAETSDGGVRMYARATLGRILASRSDDDGVHWSRGLPNELCSSNSPVRLRSIPTTGDLHCVWNQVTAAEIRGGYRRSRLTSAISRDNGESWQHFTTLDCADTLDKAPRQTPDPDMAFVVADDECGEMPDNFSTFRYPNVRYVGDLAYINYDRESFKFPGSPARQHVLRALPIEWLYDDSRTDLSLPNDVAAAAALAEGEDIED